MGNPWEAYKSETAGKPWEKYSTTSSPPPPSIPEPSLMSRLTSNPLVRGLNGIAEAGTNLATGMGASAVGGINGINTLLGGGSLDDATRRIQDTQQKYTYQPRTAEGQVTAYVAGLPIELASKATKFVGGELGSVFPAVGRDAGEAIGESVPAVAATLLGGRAALKAAPQPMVTGTAADPLLQAKLLREAGNDSMRLDSIAKAKDAGLTINPAAVQRTFTNKTASALVGDTDLNRVAFEKNSPLMNQMMKEDIGVPDGTPLSKDVLSARVDEAAAPYNEIRQISRFNPDGQFVSDINSMNDLSSHSPAVQEFLKQNAPKLQEEVQQMTKDGFNGEDVVTLMQKFRKEANSTLSRTNSLNPPGVEELALANAKRSAAKAIEGMVDRNLTALDETSPGQGYGDLANRFREGRTTIAKIKTVEPFIDGNGNFVPSKSFRLGKNNSSYTGNMRTLADVSASFPESFMPTGLNGGPVNVSHSGVVNSIRHVVSTPLRAGVMSDWYQQRNMSGLDPRDVRTRLGYDQAPPTPEGLSLAPPGSNIGVEQPAPQPPQVRPTLELAPQGPITPTPSWTDKTPIDGPVSLHGEQYRGMDFPLRGSPEAIYRPAPIETPQIPSNGPYNAQIPPTPSELPPTLPVAPNAQGGSSLPVLSEDLMPQSQNVPLSQPLSPQGISPSSAQGTPLPQLPPQGGQLLSLEDRAAAANMLRSPEVPSIDFMGKTEAWQQPPIVKATQQFVAEAERLRGLVANSTGFWKNRYANELAQLEKQFGEGAQLMGARNPADLYSSIYQSGNPQLPVQSTFDARAMASQLRSK